MTGRSAAPDRGQLPLAINLRDDATLDNFLVRPALEALAGSLQQQVGGGGEAFIYLCGPAGTGKSHLLQACCHAQGGAAQYLPLADLRDFPPDDVLQGLAGMELVCLDDLQAVVGAEAWELALFNFYNEAHKQGCRLLVAASEPPRALALQLEDLRSRLSSGVVYQLRDASDEGESGHPDVSRRAAAAWRCPRASPPTSSAARPARCTICCHCSMSWTAPHS